MELTKNYKLTDYGIIPTDWKEIVLGKSSLLKARIGWQGLTTAEYLKDGNYYLITGTEFKDGFIDWDSCYYVSKERYEQDKFIQVKESDILITKDGTIGKVAFVEKVPKPATLNSGVFVIRPLNDSYNPRFTYYILRSSHFKTFLNKLSAGSTINHLYQKDFVHYKIPLPPTPEEQQAIATALSDIDTLITNLDKLIAKKKAIKQGAMQRLLKAPDKGGKRLPGFEGEWISDKVENIMKVYRGGSPRPIQAYLTESANGINWIKIGDTDKFGKYIKSSEERIIPEGQNFSRNVYIGDFLLSNSMSFGRPYILKIDGCIHDGWLVLQNYQSSLDTEFLYYLLISREVHNQYLSKAAGSGVLNLNKELVKSVELTFPKSLEEQKSIASVFCDMDTEIESLESKKSKYLLIKQGMMQELLTGKTRLI